LACRWRELLDSLRVPEPRRGNVDASLLLIDQIDRSVCLINKRPANAGFFP
jgi:hypothetical protein